MGSEVTHAVHTCDGDPHSLQVENVTPDCGHHGGRHWPVTTHERDGFVTVAGQRGRDCVAHEPGRSGD